MEIKSAASLFTGASTRTAMIEKKTAKSVTELLGGVLEPVLARRTGMRIDLMRAWPELAGGEFAKTTRPEKIEWPRRRHEDDPFEPATLLVACEPSAALFFQHEQSGVVERVNLFFGFYAVKRIRIVQKPVLKSHDAPALTARSDLSLEEEARLSDMLSEIEDPDLKKVLKKLGSGVLKRSGK